MFWYMMKIEPKNISGRSFLRCIEKNIVNDKFVSPVTLINVFEQIIHFNPLIGKADPNNLQKSWLVPHRKYVTYIMNWIRNNIQVFFFFFFFPFLMTFWI
jgi:hypothetical protein